jgi:hypothetical protein
LAVSSAGDVDGDGGGDLLIGAPNADPNVNNSSGASYVVFGGPLPPPRRTCNGLPVTIQGTDNGEILNGTSGNDVIDGQVETTCSAAKVAKTSSAAVTAETGCSAARVATSVRPEGPRCAERRPGRDRCDGGGGTDTARRCEVRVRVR